MNIAEHIQSGFTTKSFDPSHKLSANKISQIETLLRFCPSSPNIQPWHFFLASSQDAKERIAEAATGFFEFNKQKLLDASLLVVFCVRSNVDDAYLRRISMGASRQSNIAKRRETSGSSS